MTWAPSTGCCSSSPASNASAGGQLEQPSEVNSSTTTGVRCASEGAGEDCPRDRMPAKVSRIERPRNINPEKRAFIEIHSRLPRHGIRALAQSYGRDEY